MNVYESKKAMAKRLADLVEDAAIAEAYEAHRLDQRGPAWRLANARMVDRLHDGSFHHGGWSYRLDVLGEVERARSSRGTAPRRTTAYDLGALPLSLEA